MGREYILSYMTSSIQRQIYYTPSYWKYVQLQLMKFLVIFGDQIPQENKAQNSEFCMQ